MGFQKIKKNLQLDKENMSYSLLISCQLLTPVTVTVHACRACVHTAHVCKCTIRTFSSAAALCNTAERSSQTRVSTSPLLALMNTREGSPAEDMFRRVPVGEGG